MGIDINFAQGADPTKFTTADWSRAFRKAPVKPSAQSITPTELATSTTDLIDTTAQTAASAAADAAQAAAIAASNANAVTLSASAQATAISTAATALSDHVSAPDPHSQYTSAGELATALIPYLTQAAGDARYLQQILTLTNAVNDAAAASAGVAVGQLYRTGSIVMIRVT